MSALTITIIWFTILVGEGYLAHDDILIGFTAWTQDVQEYNLGDPVLFEGVNINQGDYYQPSSARFLCAHDGVYLVTVNAKRAIESLNIEVIIGTKGIFKVVDNENENDYNTVSNSALVQCNQGDIISVVGDSDFCEIYGEPGVPLSTFSVVLMSSPEINRRQQHNGTFMGFTAYLNDGVTYDTGDVIIFSNTILSSEHYDTATGMFTCPLTGIYLVNLNLRKQLDQQLNLGIGLDSEVILHSSDIYGSNQKNTVSNSRYVACSSGQRLYVTALGLGQVHGNSARRTTFSVMLMSETSNLKKQHSDFLGFSGFKRSPQSYSAGDVVQFDGILLNEGNDFDGESYVCPRTGIYFLSAHFKRQLAEPIYLNVVEDDTILLFRLEDSFTNNPQNTISNSGMFLCVAGETVKVKAYGDGALNGDPNSYYTTLSVMLMKEI